MERLTENDSPETLERNRELLAKIGEAALTATEEYQFHQGMEKVEQRKHDYFESDRAQELVERELNEKLTTKEKLEEAILEEKPGVEKREVDYGERKIPVYDLKGFPYTFLSTAVDYRRANLEVNGGVGDIGTQTFQDVVENPSIWTETREEAEKSTDYGTRSANARGDTISCSYTNSETNPDTRVGSHKTDKNLVYGFEAVRPDSIIYAVARDGGTSNVAGKNRTSLDRSSIDTIKNLENNPTVGYNEVLLRRYDESGKPLKPSYIIGVDGVITDDMLKHADFFKIPILNVETQAYRGYLDKRAVELVSQISEDSSYDEVLAAADTLKHSPRYGHSFNLRNGYGRKYDQDGITARREFQYPYELREKLANLEELEFKKRLDLIAEDLEKEADYYEQANSEGRVAESYDSKVISRSHIDAENSIETDNYQDLRNGIHHVPGNPNMLHLDFAPNKNRRISMTLYDGEHPYAVEEAIRRGNLKESDLEQADSSPYERIKPLFDRAVAAHRANNELRKSLAKKVAS